MKKNKLISLLFVLVLIVSATIVPVSASELNATHIYSENFSNSFSGWTEFGVNENSLSIQNDQIFDKSLCMSNHTKDWYSPSYNIYPLMQSFGAGTYWFEVKVKYTGSAANPDNLAHLEIRGNGSNSFLVNENGNYCTRISCYYIMEADMWYTMRGSLKILEGDLSSSAPNKLLLCVNEVPSGTDVQLFIDDVKIYKMDTVQITNGDFSNELIGWRGWCSLGNDILNYDLDACAQYVRAKLYGSIATNVDQILTTYGTGNYLLEFDLSESHWDQDQCSKFKIFLSKGTSSFHYAIDIIDVDNNNGSNHFSVSFNLTDMLYSSLSPDTHEVFLRFEYLGNQNEVIAYYLDNVELTKLLPTSGYEIEYDTTLWNDDDKVSYAACYAYALNDYHESTDYAITTPGYAANFTYSKNQISVDNVVEGLMRDSEKLGFTCNKVNRDTICSEGTYKIALVIAPGQDFHFYRQNPDGTWSHKRGGTPVNKLDASGNIICDPETADRLYNDSDGVTRNYSEFAGYFEVSPLKG